MLLQGKTYEEMCAAFRWNLPERFNIAYAACDQHAERTPDNPALIHERPDGSVEVYSFGRLQKLANRMANVFQAHGLRQGDRIMVLLGQDPATAVAHLAAWKAGMITMPTSRLFGSDALEHRINDSGASAVVTDLANYPKLLEIRDRTPTISKVFLVDAEEPGAIHFWNEQARASDRFETLSLPLRTPALISYTSGTTGLPKGAVHGHNLLPGSMPALTFSLDFMPQPHDVMWSPADWSWIAGLFTTLMPSLCAGMPVVVYQTRSFDAEDAMRVMGKHKVRTALLTPTMLKLMRQAREPKTFGVNLRSMISGSETVGKELLEWASKALNVHVNEVFGQTECNIGHGNSWQVLPARIGSIGKPIPGMEGSIVDDDGNVLPAGTIGNIAYKAPHPVLMLEYWNNPKATKEKFANGWMLTGDLGTMDEDGYYWYGGRSDDVITSAGYRIGPGEIEDALMRHPSVVMAAAIGVPDDERTEIIKAFIKLADGFQPTPELAEEIRNSVRERLARHEYPREIAFVDSMPMTTTGKIMRRELREMEKASRAGKTPA